MPSILGTTSLSPRVANILKWSLGAVVIGVLLLRLDTGSVFGYVTQASWPLVAGALVGLTAIHVVGAATWKVLLSRIAGIVLSWAFTLRTYYAAQAAGSLTPSNLGADAYRMYAVARVAGHWSSTLAPIAAQRISSYLAIAALGVVAAVASPIPDGARTTVLSLAVGSIAVVVLLAVFLGPKLQIGRSRFLRSLSGASTGCDRSSWLRAMTLATGLSLVFHVGSVGLGYLLVVAVGGEGAVVPTLAILLLARLALLIPFSVSGLGIQEGAAVVLFPMIGMEAEIGLAAVLLSRIALLATVALGAVFLTSPKRSPGKLDALIHP